MNRSWWLRFGLLFFFFVVAVVHVVPTVANLNLETTKFPFKKKVNLGLDLQGGLYMVYGVDFKKVYTETLNRSVEGALAQLAKENVSAKMGKLDESMEEDPKVSIEFDAALEPKVKEFLEKQQYALRVLDRKPGSFELSLARDYRATIKEHTLSQSVQVIRNRIDEFGVSEPSITTEGWWNFRA